MADYILVSTLDNLKFSNRWKESHKFHAYARFLDKDGKYVNASYPGRKYQICLKKERYYTVCERFTRIIEGILYTLLSLGLSNLSKSNRQLFTEDKKVLRFAVELIQMKPPRLDIFDNPPATPRDEEIIN